MEIVRQQKLADRCSLTLVHGDITKTKVDAIVNAANAQLQHGGGVAGAISKRGGSIIQSESNAWVRKHGPITHNTPAITSAGELPCKYVIHAVGPIWGEGEEDAKLHMAVESALYLAMKERFQSIAFPAISTGIYGFPKDRGAKVILDTIIEFMNQNPDCSLTWVEIVLIDEPSVETFKVEFDARWEHNE